MVVIVSCHILAPPSGRSSRVTDVNTQCLNPIFFITSASFSGSFWSGGSGFDLLTAQKRQLRVQLFPSIIKVAVFCSQHSAMLGHLPLSHMVCRLNSDK